MSHRFRLLLTLVAFACLAPATAHAAMFEVEGSFGAGQLADPTALGIDSAGRVYVADAAAHRILKLRQLLPVTH